MARSADAGLRSETVWCVVLRFFSGASDAPPPPLHLILAVHQVTGGGRGSGQTCCVSRYRVSGEPTEAEPGVKQTSGLNLHKTADL